MTMKTKPTMESVWPLVVDATDAMRSSAFNNLFGQTEQAIKTGKLCNDDMAEMFKRAIKYGIKYGIKFNSK